MAEYLHPGVYVEEVSSGVRPIEGVGTSTAGFIGKTAKGVPNKATFITSWTEFVRKFGYLTEDSYLPYAVSQFFENGGKRCYVVRVLDDASSVAATIDLTDREDPTARNTLRIEAKGKGAWGNDLAVRVEDGTDNPTREFKLVVLHQDEAVEVFDNLSMDTAALSYVETEVNDASEYIEVEDLDAHVIQQQATATSTAALADPVVFAGGGETLTIELPDGSTDTVTFTGSTARADVVSALNAAWGAFNVTASLTATTSPPANRLVITHGSAGYDRYFTLSGSATAAGRPLAGLDGFQQGRGAAVGATLKSAVGTAFDTSGGNDQLDVSVHGDALTTITLTGGANTPIDTIRGEIAAAFASQAAGLLSVAREGNRLVISAVNRGENDNALVVGGTANTVLQFQNIDPNAVPLNSAAGQGRSDPAFLQSGAGPFLLQDGSNFTLRVNNGTLGATADVTVTFSAPPILNLQQVSAQTVAATINAATGAGTAISASAVNNRVVIGQVRQGNAYTLELIDGSPSANLRLGFETARQSGYVEGDKSSPYLRPDFNLDASGVNQAWELTNGDDGSSVSDFDYVGTADKKTGLHALDDVTDVNFIAVPGNASPNVIGKTAGYCASRRDCFFIADSPEPKNGTTTDPVEARDFLLNKVTTKESYAAFYYPWLQISDPIGAGKNPKRLVPPSGFVAGLYARTDTNRGVWKAPAGTEATVRGALELEYSVTDAEQDILNPVGVNCLRQFPASGINVWGARTMATRSDPEWRYVPVRRYAIYLAQSIYNGTQWAVFEPNDEPLWESLEANLTDFMMGEFLKGALAGSTPDKAFEVKCDADLNPASEVNAGRVNMEVKFAPLKPAEFVIIRISQKIQRPES